MSIEIKVPMLPESINEAQVATWHKKEGDFCQEGDVITELETDKVMLEVVATSQGILEKVQVSEGDMVTADTVLAIIQPSDDVSVKEVPKEETLVVNKSEDIPASPSVRREMHQNNMNSSNITGSGRGGRILNEDLKGPSRVKMSRIRAKIAERLVEAQHTCAMLSTFNEVNMEPIII